MTLIHPRGSRARRDPGGPRGQRLATGRNPTKADVYIRDDGGGEVVVKTVETRPALFRLLVAEPLLRREARVLARLAGLPGIPRLLASTGASLVLDRVAGETLHSLRRRGISAATAASFERLVDSLHARGFAHGDIGRRDVLVAPDGSARLVDFATAVGPGMPPVLWRVLLPLWRRRDRARAARLGRRYRRRWELNAARKACANGGGGGLDERRRGETDRSLA